MESFYWIVLVVAITALIGALAYVGILMTYYTKKDAVYPPVESSCPDFWTASASSPNKCNIPAGEAAGIKNIGSLYTTTTNGDGKPVYTLKLSTANTPGLDATNKTVDFSAAEWGAGSGAVCKKQSWANQNGLIWDGVSNYNSC